MTFLSGGNCITPPYACMPGQQQFKMFTSMERMPRLISAPLIACESNFQSRKHTFTLSNRSDHLSHAEGGMLHRSEVLDERFEVGADGVVGDFVEETGLVDFFAALGEFSAEPLLDLPGRPDQPGETAVGADELFREGVECADADEPGRLLPSAGKLGQSGEVHPHRGLALVFAVHYHDTAGTGKHAGDAFEAPARSHRVVDHRVGRKARKHPVRRLVDEVVDTLPLAAHYP